MKTNDLSEFGLAVPDVLVPREVPLGVWSVIACDQYTQDAAYWKRVEEAVGPAPSTLKLILPEIYLAAPDKDERVARIKDAMRAYLRGGVFGDEEHALVYIERQTAYGRVRRGLLAAVDLDCYEWKPFAKSLVRATEQTIAERLPVRKEIRRGAALDIPHIMLLVNDRRGLLHGAAREAAASGAPLYDGDLMLNSGHVTGWALRGGAALGAVTEALSRLKDDAARTGGGGEPFLFAVGDGNHSLATAKAVWDDARSSGAAQPRARYALAEIVNLYDPGLVFEPIHRVLLGTGGRELARFLEERLACRAEEEAGRETCERALRADAGSLALVFSEGGALRVVRLSTGIRTLLVSAIEPLLQEYASAHGAAIDYIHGTDEVFRLGAKQDAVSVMLPPIAKEALFDTVAKSGPLPRKSFSMGESSEKRFYLECRRLFD